MRHTVWKSRSQNCRARSRRNYLPFIALIVLLLVRPAFADTRVALVIGNAGYAGPARLPNPGNDARDIATALEGLGFKVITGLDVNKSVFDAKLHEFARAAANADVAIFFYSGHGMQINGVNYLIPIDAPVTKEDLDFQTVTLDFVQKVIGAARTKIVVLDACRNNPFAKDLGTSLGTRAVNENAGLAVTTAPDLGSFVAFATQPGHVASDGAGSNSPFTGALKVHIGTPGLSISDLMIVVRNEVVQATNGAQIPWDHSALSMRFYFKEGPVAELAEAGRIVSDAAEVWGWVRDTSNPQVLEQFIAKYGSTPFADQARARLAALKQSRPRAEAASLPFAGNLPLRPSRPSYDCRLQHSDAEVTICNNPELSLLDNEIDRLYVQSLRTPNEARRKKLISEQREWMKARNACSTDVSCLTGQYQARIQTLKASALPPAAPSPELKPSFDCRTQFLPAEATVCRSADLVQLDLEMDRLYTQKLKAASGLERQALVNGQRHWLRNRDTCSSNAACLKIQYQARIERLKR